jgi:hypothetical protein
MINGITNVKTYLNIGITDTSYNSILSNLISEVNKEIINRCRQEIEMTTQTINFGYIDTQNKDYYMLPNFPVDSLVSLKTRTNPLDTFVDVAAGLYTLDQKGGIGYIYYPNGFIENYEYQATFRYGYNTVPYDIEQIGIEMLAIKFKESENRGGIQGGRLGLNSINENSSQGIASTVAFKDMNERWNNVIKFYRNVIV